LPQSDNQYGNMGGSGIGPREDRDPITRNSSRLLPHYFA
jgi:hypothetical protein